MTIKWAYTSNNVRGDVIEFSFKVFHAENSTIHPSIYFSVLIAIAPFIYEVLEREAMFHDFFGPVHKCNSVW
ncbi:hypothetical protein, partial [Enterobacter hormaechei]|uniref:hypothetical protein n=1 Tax=Enterobacter hormaechei TaxID=158836 RepID=UPI0023E3D45A